MALAAVALVLGAGSAAAQELPGGVRLGGGAYLYHFEPLDVEGVDEETEIYALFLTLDRSWGPWRIHVEGRGRDTKLRSFFPSNVWLQEAWVSYTTGLGGDGGPGEGYGTGDGGGGDGESSGDGGGGDEGGAAGPPPRPELTVRAGKIYQRFGRFWDGSFFGNLHYFDGLKLDPELGVEARLRLPGPGAGDVELYGQALLDSDRVNGSLPGRDLEGEDGAEEDGFAAGVRWETPLARIGGDPLVGAARVSGLLERVERGEASAEDAGDGSAPPPVDAELEHLAADLEVRWRDLVTYVEWSRRAGGGPGAVAVGADTPAAGLVRGPAGSRATWWLAGARARVGPVALRYNFSTAGYDDAGFREYIHQPGVTVEAAPGVSLLVEYDDWRREGAGVRPGGGVPSDPDAADARIDRSLNFVLLLEF